jgi:hypothetical protein
VVRNLRAGLDWNTCGQAAAATVLAFHAAGPFAAGAAPDDGAAIDHVRSGFPPDLPFGLGTSPWRLAAALRAHGLDAEVMRAGPFGAGLARAWSRVREHAAGVGPVPVCLDDGLLGGAHGGVHWAVVLDADADGVRLGNAGRAGVLPLGRFLAAWRCRHLPWPFDACAVLAGPPTAGRGAGTATPPTPSPPPAPRA